MIHSISGSAAAATLYQSPATAASPRPDQSNQASQADDTVQLSDAALAAAGGGLDGNTQ